MLNGRDVTKSPFPFVTWGRMLPSVSARSTAAFLLRFQSMVAQRRTAILPKGLRLTRKHQATHPIQVSNARFPLLRLVARNLNKARNQLTKIKWLGTLATETPKDLLATLLVQVNQTSPKKKVCVCVRARARWLLMV